MRCVNKHGNSTDETNLSSLNYSKCWFFSPKIYISALRKTKGIEKDLEQQ